MAVDLDVVFLALLFLVWTILGLIPWLVAAVIRRGRGALITLPLAIVGGAGGGVLVPAAGARDEAGLFLSLSTAFLGGLALSLLGPLLFRPGGKPHQENGLSQGEPPTPTMEGGVQRGDSPSAGVPGVSPGNSYLKRAGGRDK